MLMNSDDFLGLEFDPKRLSMAMMMEKGKAEINEPARLELLAEECAELAHAALKLARILRGENPTDASLEKTRNNVLEEACDVCICLDMADIPLDQGLQMRKLKRLTKRLATAEKGEPDER